MVNSHLINVSIASYGDPTIDSPCILNEVFINAPTPDIFSKALIREWYRIIQLMNNLGPCNLSNG